MHLAHGADGTHPAVGLVGTPLVELDFTGRLLGAGKQATDHHRIGAGDERFRDVSGVADTAIGDQRNSAVAQRVRHLGDGRYLGYTDACDDTGRADRPRADADLDAVSPRLDQGFRRIACDDVAAEYLHVRVLLLDARDAVEHAFRKPVRGIDDEHVDARLDQRIDPVVRIVAGADRRTDPKRPARILAGAWEVLGFLEILGGDHALQFEVVADHQHLLDAVLVQQRHNLFLVGALAHGHQALLRSHDRGHRRIELCLKAQIAAGHYANGLVLADDRHARDAHGARQVDDLADGHVGRHGDRVAHDAALEFLDRVDLPRLFLDRHVLVDDADAAFLGERDGEPRLGDGVHGGREDRNIERDFCRQPRAEIDFAGQHLRVAGLQEDIVERQGFLGDAHGLFRVS